jgi:hypothetical protein
MAPKSFANFEKFSKLRTKLEKLLIIFRQGVGKDLKQKNQFCANCKMHFKSATVFIVNYFFKVRAFKFFADDMNIF